jgi:hypothetical protein
MLKATLHAKNNLQKLVFCFSFLIFIVLVQRTEQAYSKTFVLDTSGVVTMFSSTFTAERDISPGVVDPTAVAVDSGNRLLIFGQGTVQIRDATSGDLISEAGLTNKAGATVHSAAAAVGRELVNEFLQDGRKFTAIERSVPDNDPQGLCPETNPNDRRTWKIFAINPEFTNISQTVSLKALQYVVRILSGGNTLINADNAPPAGGVGSTVTVPNSALGPDGILSPGESFHVVRQAEGEPLGVLLVCLASRSRFQLFVDVLGTLIPE